MNLFTPVYMKHNLDRKELDKAYKKINEISDQKKLLEIALNAPDEWVRRYALNRINDQSIIKEMAQKKDCPQRYAFIDKITDQKFLLKLALEDERVRSCAISNMTDQEGLLRLALLGSSNAFDRLTNSAAVIQAAWESSEKRVRLSAINKLAKTGNQIELRKIAEEETDPEIRLEAVLNLNNSETIAKFAPLLGQYKGYYSRFKDLVSRLNDPPALLEIAANTGDDRIIKQCLEKLMLTNSRELTGLDPDKIVSILQKNDDPKIKADASRLLDRCGSDRMTDEDHENLRKWEMRRKVLTAISTGQYRDLLAEPKDVFDILADEFQKFIDEYTKERVYVSFDEHFKSRGLEKIGYYKNIAEGLRLLHDRRNMKNEVEQRFPEGRYTCNYYWLEGGDNGSSVECDGMETVVVWEKR